MQQKNETFSDFSNTISDSLSTIDSNLSSENNTQEYIEKQINEIRKLRTKIDDAIDKYPDNSEELKTLLDSIKQLLDLAHFARKSAGPIYKDFNDAMDKTVFERIYGKLQ